MDSYRTINENSIISFEVNKSEFIGAAFPLSSEKDVPVFLNNIKRLYPGASHYVYAYTLGRGWEIQKFSDDGEPSGTAGMPMLELIKHRKLVDLLIIAVRYYGGIKLGTGGLKRAYSKTAQDAIQASGVVILTLCFRVRIQLPYHFWGKIQHMLTQENIQISSITYEDEVAALLIISQDQLAEWKEKLLGITASQIQIEVLNQEYCSLNSE